jgi:hypothetical protein
MPTKPMRNVMVDLETVGRRPGCAILSIGAVLFDPDSYRLGKSFYKEIRLQSCYDIGLHSDQNTLDWWSKQSEEARVTFTSAQKASRKNVPVTKALEQFTAYLRVHDLTGNSMKVWGNGANFDNTILGYAYHRCNMDLPWNFWNDRCFRTLKNLRPNVKVVRQGVHHNALDDARHQAEHALEIFKALAVR